MATKKILVVGMVDSVHLGRWLQQFSGTNVEFTIFPSKKFRYLDKNIVELLENNKSAVYKFATIYSRINPKLIGYFDYFLNTILFKLTRINLRKILFKNTLESNTFDYVHLLEIQGSGYLYLESINNKKKPNNIILTNYGSDIYYFSQFEDHRKKIESILKIVNFYSAECIRDYVLARKFKFTGIELPCIPNAGGAEIKTEITPLPSCSTRKFIIVKAYGGVFGRADLLFNVFSKLLEEGLDENVFFYSVTDDYAKQAAILNQQYPEKFSYSTVKNPTPRNKLLEIFSRSKIYVGASRSDGISTSFLEAILNGVYPIQTSTSCVSEWINKGCIASLVAEDVTEIYRAIKTSIDDDIFLDNAQLINQKIAKQYLDPDKIKNDAFKFYGVTN